MKSLKGTKTEKNLKDAFAGESQANRRYLYFAQKADVEGFNDVAAVFRSTAEGETGHAHGQLEYLEAVGDPATGLPIGSTSNNLKASIAGETHEYPQAHAGEQRPLHRLRPHRRDSHERVRGCGAEPSRRAVAGVLKRPLASATQEVFARLVGARPRTVAESDVALAGFSDANEGGAAARLAAYLYRRAVREEALWRGALGAGEKAVFQRLA